MSCYTPKQWDIKVKNKPEVCSECNSEDIEIDGVSLEYVCRCCLTRTSKGKYIYIGHLLEEE